MTSSPSESPEGENGEGNGGGSRRCEPLNHQIPNGHLVCTGELVGDTCWIECLNGHKVHDPLAGLYKCLGDGTWKGMVGTCELVDCGLIQVMSDPLYSEVSS